MIEDPYICLAAGVQAARRKVEGLGLALGGALGVAAEPYPHQIASVSRILTDTRIRHLLSDEVGLGKTVQTLMVLNALRCQNPAHRAVILVPDRLVTQWHTECWSRAHTHASVLGDPTDDDEQFVRIVRPQSLQSGEFQLDPAEFDMLIVDEPQILPVEVMDQVERMAGEFRQFLILSATPGLGDPENSRRMMAMLEPERTACAISSGFDPVDSLDRLELSALEEGEARPAERASLYRTFSRSRRIIRATRAEWSRYLPKRRYERVEPEPLNGETERVRIGLEWFRSTPPQDGGWRAAQSFHRGLASARSAARTARDGGSVSKAIAATGDTPGDSRLDALLDIMAGIWSEHPAEQIIVVAGDNPTIDFLEPRIARNFASDGEVPGVATLRRMGESLDSEAADMQAMHEQLSAFSSGTAKVLLIGEWIQAGLNLHYFARNIVFYSSPWEPDAVDQLIGRLDRLRPNGLNRGDRGDHLGNIRVWTVVQPDTPEQRVVEGLEIIGVYEKPLPPLSPEAAQLVHESLQQYGFRNDRSARDRLSALAAGWYAQGNRSVLDAFSPYTARSAQQQYDRLQLASLPQPVLLESKDRSYSSRSELALEGLLRVAEKGGFFQISVRKDHENPERRFSTIWYPEGGEKNGTIGLPDNSTGRLSRDLEMRPRKPTWMTGHIPYLAKRRHLSRPPANIVHTDDGEPSGRPLRFLDHGDSLHDALIAGFIDHARKACAVTGGTGRTVMFDERHPALPETQGRNLFATVAWVDAAAHLLPPPDLSSLEARAELAPTPAQQASHRADLELAREWWRADLRWLRSELAPLLMPAVFHLDGRSCKLLPDSVAWSVLSPIVEMPDSYCARSRGNPVTVPVLMVNEARRRAAETFALRSSAWCRAEASRLGPAIEERIGQIKVELDDLLAVREADVEKQSAGPAPLGEQARTGRIAAAQRAVRMIEEAGQARVAWLRAIAANPQPSAASILGEVLFRPVSASAG